VFLVNVGKGEEVIETITRQVQQHGVRDAAITLIGAVEGCCVSVMPKGDALDDILTEYPQPLEITGTGEVTAGKVHVHVTAGGENCLVAGHLHWARVDHWFVHAYVTPLA
jgi:predicted DNA-binding protein with PD1-like motif